MYAIETRDLTKRYNGFTAVDNLTMHVRRGTVYGFLGPNGAGKSTTMKLLLGIIKPGGGELSVDGKSYPRERMEILRHVGSFIEQPAFYPNLTGAENLDILRRILGLGRESVAEALDTVGLTQFASRQARKYSLGMKQRLGLAGALLGRPPILILDEPTSGLDPVTRDELLDILLDFIQDEGHSVLISSHILSDLEKACDYITFIHSGRVIFSEEKDELLDKYVIAKGSEREISALDSDAVVGVRRGAFGSEALVERRAAGALTHERASIEDIMLYYIKGDAK